MDLDPNKIDTHVAMRDGLPLAIRPTLLEESQTEWKQHPRFAGKASFFMKIHRQLLDGADWLAQTTEALVEAPESSLRDRAHAAALVNQAGRLLAFAHGHHEIEDHGYFPQFAQLYPQLDRALGLLDADHTVLDETLNGIETNLQYAATSRDHMAALHKNAAALKKIMHRHITDEEDVIIPIFLRHG
jgi:hemerythrin-like domain-containing protein